MSMMDALRPGHAHRSSSDRLLNNYLDSQKALNTSLLTLLSHSHSSTSSLLAYVTSSPGVVAPVRRSVRHAGFEGPLSAALTEGGGSHLGSSVNGGAGDTGSPGWAAYLSSLEQFRKDLKQIHLLEEELSRVKRDREILVTRLIKTTKSRPKKSDLSAMASSYASQAENMSSRASTISITSAGSTASKDGKRAGKLAEAQAELLGCEEHLRSLEVRIEHERNNVMLRGLEEKFKAMETVGRMWIGQAKRGLEDLEKAHELPHEAYELDSNGSIAPSQSASQIDYYDDRPSPNRRNFPKVPRGLRGPGSITESITEENESSDEENQGNLVVHENRPNGNGKVSRVTKSNLANHQPNKPSPLGVPSVNSRARPLSGSFIQNTNRRGNPNDSDSDDGGGRQGGRRAASDVGAMGYRPPSGRQPLRRTFSHDDNNNTNDRRANSDTSSIHRVKKKGFFASISRFFKGGSRKQGSVRSGRDSPPYGSSSVGRSGKGGWSTRTDTNLKRASSGFGRGGGGRGGDSSSDDDGGLVSVSNKRNSVVPGWSAADVGRPPSSMGAKGVKRSSTLPVASGLIPAKPTRSDLGANKRNSSQSTVRATSPLPSGQKTPTMSRSNTLKSSASVGAKSTTSAGVKSNTSAGVKSVSSAGTAAKTGSVKKKTPVTNGQIVRAAVGSQQAAEGRTIMSLVDMPTPVMPEVPKAPKSQVYPQMELPKAPGSSIVPAGSSTTPKISVSKSQSQPSVSQSQSQSQKSNVSRSNSTRKVDSDNRDRSTTPLPPSRLLSPPLKSALRPSSPSAELAPPLDLPTNMFSISAPGPVQVPREEPKPVTIPMPAARPKTPAGSARPVASKRSSYHSMTTDGGESVYESATEGEGARQEQQAGGWGEESSGSEEEEEEDESRYQVVDNDKIRNAGEFEVGPPEVVKIPFEGDQTHEEEYDYPEGGDGDGGSTLSENTATGKAHVIDDDDRASRRKSVRITAPGSPELVRAPSPVTSAIGGHPGYDRTGAMSPPPDLGPQQHQAHEQWDTRIGRVNVDSSDDEDEIDPGYLKARKGLIKNTGKWENVKAAVSPASKGSGLKKKLSVKSKTSNKGGSARG